MSMTNASTTVAHEIKNLLQVIGANAELALLREDPEQTRKALHAILAVVDKATGIATDVGPAREVTEEADLLTCLDEALALIGPVLQRHDIRLVEQFSPLPSISFDREGMHTVFTNLALNAIDAMAQTGGSLTAKAFVLGESVVISFSDTGCGMSHDVIERVFSPHFSTKGPNRAGIGLAVCREIVAAHGGTICLWSTPGEGSTFVIQLPARREEHMEPVHGGGGKRAAILEPQGVGAAEASRKVLIVDDELVLRDTLAQLLQREGYHVCTAADGGQAVSICGEDSFDVVLMDRSMPGMDGTEALRAIKQNCPDTAVLLFSGAEPDQNGPHTGEDGFVRKPFRLEQVLEAISTATAG